MIDRYTRPKMKAIWDHKHKYEIWLEVELQACAAFERAGQAPRGTAAGRFHGASTPGGVSLHKCEAASPGVAPCASAKNPPASSS